MATQDKKQISKQKTIKKKQNAKEMRPAKFVYVST
jgi:hypothetical protein